MKAVCVYHSIDLDGWMSAAIVQYWYVMKYNPKFTIFKKGIVANEGFDSLDFIGYNYGQPIPDLSEYERVIMCDICFPKESMLDINLKLGEKFIWIDHHQPKIDEINAHIIEFGIPMEGLVTEPGEFKAACELTWKYFFPDEPIPEIVRLLGRYDCFGHKGTEEELKVLEFQYGAREAISNYQEAYEHLILSMFGEPNEIETKILANGKSIYKYLCSEAKQSYKNGFEIEFTSTKINGTKLPDQSGIIHYKFICINKERFNPINFGIDYHSEGYDGCACFHYADGLWNFSVYNDNGLVDCSAIAKQFGGGGHKGASGFRVLNIEDFLKSVK